LLTDILFVAFGDTAPWVAMVLAAGFGATVFAMYPVVVAHANDHAAPGSAIQVSGGLLLVFGIGSIIGPTVAGVAMTSFGAAMLFVVTASAHALLLGFAVLRIRYAPPVDPASKGSFQATPLARSLTPETATLAPSAEELRLDRPDVENAPTAPDSTAPKE
jgi:MFS family permease